MEKFFIIAIIFSGMIPLAFGEAYIQNDQKYIGDDGAFHIVGEIKNSLEVPLNQINVLVTLLDENMQVIATKETNSLVNTIMPGMKGPFDLVLTNNEAKQIRSYSLQLDYKVSTPKNQVIEIINSELSRDSHNNLSISGTVANRGDITANTMAITATLYDEEGNVAIVTRVNTEPDYLRAEDTSFFLVPIPDKSQNSGINNYALIAESEEFAVVPEFPVGTLVLLAGAFSAYIGIVRYRGNVIIN